MYCGQSSTQAAGIPAEILSLHFHKEIPELVSGTCLLCQQTDIRQATFVASASLSTAARLDQREISRATPGSGPGHFDHATR